MAVTITDHRTIRDEADALTGWTGSATLALYTADPAPIEATGQIGANIGAVQFDAYHTAAAANLSSHVIYQWVFSRVAQGDRDAALGGLMIYVGDGTHAGAWKVNGADFSPFRHDVGPTGWTCPALDTANLPASPVNKQGSGGASVNFAAATRVGVAVNSLVAAPGMNPTFHFDIVRILDPALNNGCALSIIGGTTGDRGTFAQIAAADRATGNQQAHGILRELASGAYGCQGPLRFGNAAGTSDSWFDDTNAVLVFEDRRFRTTLYKIFITDNGTGTTNFILTNCALIAPSGVGASFDSLTDTDVTAVTVTGTRIEGFTQGVGIGGGAGQIFTNCIFSNGGAVSVTSQPVDLTGSSVLTSTVAADASALVWNVATNPDGFLDRMTFSKGTAAHHAIEFGATAPVSITLNDVTFTGFNGANGNNDSTLNFTDGTGKNYTVNIIGGTTPSYKVAGTSTVTIVANPVTTLINIKDPDGNNEQSVRVYLEAANGTGDLPYQESVTINRTGSIAVVSHTAHGMNTNEYIKLSGIITPEKDNSGAFQITVNNANEYQYTSTGAYNLTYTGTIVATGATIYGLTDINGNISSSRTYSNNQPLTGYARKSDDGVIYFKPIDLDDTVNSTTGLTINRRLISDGLV